MKKLSYNDALRRGSSSTTNGTMLFQKVIQTSVSRKFRRFVPEIAQQPFLHVISLYTSGFIIAPLPNHAKYLCTGRLRDMEKSVHIGAESLCGFYRKFIVMAQKSMLSSKYIV